MQKSTSPRSCPAIDPAGPTRVGPQADRLAKGDLGQLRWMLDQLGSVATMSP